jgi:hypothetical protein
MINDINIHEEKLKAQLNLLDSIFVDNNTDTFLKDIKNNWEKADDIISKDMSNVSTTLIALMLALGFLSKDKK